MAKILNFLDRPSDQVPICILEPMSGHLVDPKSSKCLSQKVLTTATFRIGFYCLEKKFSKIFMISRIYTIHEPWLGT